MSQTWSDLLGQDVLVLVTFALKLARMDTSCMQLYVNYRSWNFGNFLSYFSYHSINILDDFPKSDISYFLSRPPSASAVRIRALQSPKMAHTYLSYLKVQHQELFVQSFYPIFSTKQSYLAQNSRTFLSEKPLVTSGNFFLRISLTCLYVLLSSTRFLIKVILLSI